LTYKQLGNGVNVGAVYNVIRAQVIRDMDLLSINPSMVRTILGAPSNPDEVLGSHKTFVESMPNLKTMVGLDVNLKLA